MSLDKLLPKLLKAQSEFPPIPKNGKNKFFNNAPYYLFEDVISKCSPILWKNELLVVQLITPNNTLKTQLFHAPTGQAIESEIVLINKAGTDQGLGSSITYAKRYSLMAMLGLSDDDDDGNEAAKKPESIATKVISKGGMTVMLAEGLQNALKPPKIATYKVPFGKKHKDKTFDQIGPIELKNYRDYIHKNLNPDTAQSEVMEFLKLSGEYLEGCK